MSALEVVYEEVAFLAFVQQPRRRIETREIVQEPREASLARVDAVTLCERVGAARDADAVGVTLVLGKMLADAPQQAHERPGIVAGHRDWNRSRKTRTRLRYSSLFRLPAHMIRALSLSSL